MTNPGAPLDWQPDSWRARNAAQQPTYADARALGQVLDLLARLPPIVSSWEVEALKRQLAKAQCGEAFVLQGGDCAERFDECQSDLIVRQLKVLLQMSLVMMMGLKKPIVRVGRLAGQYAKPRSSYFETRDGVTLPHYRGDLVNRPPFTPEDREPDPSLMLRGHERAALTLNFVRSLIDGGFADLHHPENWNLEFASESPMVAEYRAIVDSVTDSLRFFESFTADSVRAQRVDFYTSHEGLLLPYEQAQTRFLPHRQRWYNLTTHFPWIGARTLDLDGAHVEYFRGLANPVGVKIRADCTETHLQSLVRVLNPGREPGHLTLITRLGAGAVKEHLPRVIRAVKATDVPVLWMCDPMHGNTEQTKDGFKTRRFDNILDELKATFRIHNEMGSHLGGLHLELTGSNVTECLGGARGLDEADLGRTYDSLVDPRLNYEQSMEIALLTAQHLGA